MSTDTRPFGARLREAMDSRGPLCAGIDPHPQLLSAWGLDSDLAGLERFTMTCVEAFGSVVAAVKPQSAFFEQYGSRGVAVLERATDALREAGTLVVLDVKRGDIGTTMEAYARAFLGPDAPSAPDAITVSPYLGYGALRPAIDLARTTGRGMFVLALTSNPEGARLQHARDEEGVSVAGQVVAGVTADNADAAVDHRLGDIGMVVGATVGDAVRSLGLDLAAANAPLLMPGIGAQGGSADDARAVSGGATRNVLAASSRDILKAGPDGARLRAAARQQAEHLAEVLNGGAA